MCPRRLRDVEALTVTDKARTKILEIRSEEDDPDTLALWVEVAGQAAGTYSYDLYFQAAADATDGDAVIDAGEGLKVVVPSDSIDRMRGSTLDLSRDLLNPGMVIQNPNRPASAQPTPGIDFEPIELQGEVADRVRQLLEERINPAIASHGGRADLVAVEDDAAFLRLSGGCAGCAMSAVTLKQGIEVAIKEAVPEIQRVIDVTDHAAGTNPYYEAAGHGHHH